MATVNNPLTETIWCGDDTLTSIQTLQTKVQQGFNEQQEIMLYMQALASAFDTFAHNIKQIQAKSSITKVQREGFGKDEGGSLKQAFEFIKSECNEMADGYTTLASIIRDNIADPTKKASDDSKQKFKTVHQDVEQTEKAYKTLRQTCSASKEKYISLHRSMKQLQDIQRGLQTTSPQGTPTTLLSLTSFLPRSRSASVNHATDLENKMDIVFQVGSSSMTREEISITVERMQKQIPLQELKYPLIGTYQALSGQTIASWLIQNVDALKDNRRDVEAFGQNLVDLKHLKLIGRGSKFVDKDNWFYEWKKSEDQMRADELKQLAFDVSEAEKLYAVNVSNLDEFRQQFEQKVHDYVGWIKDHELARISDLKKSLETFSSAITRLSVSIQFNANHMSTALEGVNETKDFLFLCEQCRFGVQRPLPVLFEPFNSSPAVDQLFGLSLVAYSQFHRDKTPWIVEEILLAVGALVRDKPLPEKLSILCSAIHTELVEQFRVRKALNRAELVPHTDLAQVYSVAALLAVLRRYFMELPESLLTSADYDAYKTLYLSKTDQSQVEKRLMSVRDNVMNLNEYHFYTLRLLLVKLNEIILGDNSEETLHDVLDENPDWHTFLADWGPVLLRPKNSFLAAYDRHQERLLKDLILHCNSIFLQGALKPASEEKLDSIAMQRKLSQDDSQSAVAPELKLHDGFLSDASSPAQEGYKFDEAKLEQISLSSPKSE